MFTFKRLLTWVRSDTPVPINRMLRKSGVAPLGKEYNTRSLRGTEASCSVASRKCRVGSCPKDNKIPVNCKREERTKLRVRQTGHVCLPSRVRPPNTTVLSLISSFLACSELAKWPVLHKCPIIIVDNWTIGQPMMFGSSCYSPFCVMDACTAHMGLTFYDNL
jgi:hypothetical protein